MTLTCFDDLLSLAREQPEPQRLLFVFAAAGIPEDATPAQRARFEAGLANIVEVADSQALLAATEYQDGAARVDVWRALLGRAVAFDTMDAFIALVRGRE